MCKLSSSQTLIKLKERVTELWLKQKFSTFKNHFGVMLGTVFQTSEWQTLGCLLGLEHETCQPRKPVN